MKILHISYSFYPDPPGGTEIYVEILVRCLKDLGVDSIVAAPAFESAAYSYKGIPVRRFKQSKCIKLDELYNEGDPVAARDFERIIEQEKPDLLHVHSYTPACSLLLIRIAKMHSLPVVFTYHTPTVSCPQGFLIYQGRDICDGLLMVKRCAGCSLKRLGLPWPLSYFVGYLPFSVGHFVSWLGFSGDFWTALRFSQLINIRISVVNAFLKEVDCIIAVCSWVKDILVKNGVEREKIIMLRHGIYSESPQSQTQGSNDTFAEGNKTLRFVYFGRFDPAKGIITVVRAFHRLSGYPIELSIYGITQTTLNKKYENRINSMISKDPRIKILPSVFHSEVHQLLKGFDAVLVPSQWLETGPMIVLEAFQAGVPVIGSNLGGIAELVVPGLNGILLPFNKEKAWAQAIKGLCQDRSILKRLKTGIREPLKMSDVALEMKEVYTRFLLKKDAVNLK